MAINIINALLTGELGLNAFKITKAAFWDVQIRGAYGFMYPYIALDFRGIKDCKECHPSFNTVAFKKINYKTHPICKKGTSNVGVYGS